MVTLKLTDEEQDVLTKLLEEDIPELRYEIGNTDSYDYRQGLKNKEQVLKAILAQLRGT
jgi:hypothetical protein